MKDKKVLVLGEICEDFFRYGKCERLNPEAPTPVFTPTNEICTLGMAGNTSKNLTHLGVNTTLNIFKSPILRKERFVDEISNYILLRVDRFDDLVKPFDFNDLTNEYNFVDYDAIVISDYDKGLLTKDVLKKIFTTTKSSNIPTFMDTKKDIGEWANECTFIKINEKEFNNPKHQPIIQSTIFNGKLIVTLGSNGCRYKDKLFPTEKVEVRDVVGAGDTFLAGLVYGYLKNNDIEEAIKIANRLASNVVTKKGVALPNKKLL